MATYPPIVNVASVKHRSPFRYAGGKTWLVPRIRKWLESRPSTPKLFIEPFAGGAIVGLSVAFEQRAEHVVLTELDAQVAAVWQVIIADGDGPWLAEQIRDFEMSSTAVDTLLAIPHPPRSVQALQTIVKNRVNRGGILAKGAGRLNAGENGRGLHSRWYPDTLAKRIHDLDAIRERLTFIQGDGLLTIETHRSDADAVFFIDPPYTVGSKGPGRRLYECSDVDHEALFRLVASVRGDFLMTYHHAVDIIDMARSWGFDTEPVAMKNTHHALQTELLIGRDLAWLRAEADTEAL